jgi:Rrf2 family protein
MLVSKKSQYALRAILELALRNTDQPVKIREIAAAQNIPARFLEVILNELRHGGLVESRRGSEGGYMLAQGLKDLRVGEVIRCVQGPVSMTGDERRRGGASTSFFGDGAFEELWERVDRAISQVWDNTTFAELVEYERAKRSAFAPNYAI